MASNIIYQSLNLNIPLPPPYYMEVWDYKNTDPICIPGATSLVNWNGSKSPQHLVKHI